MSASSPPPARNPWAWPIVVIIGMVLTAVVFGLKFAPKETAEAIGGGVLLIACLYSMSRIG